MVVTSERAEHVPTTETAPPESSVPPSTGPRNDGSSQSSPPIAGMAAPSRATTIIPADAASRPESVWLIDDDAANRHARHLGGARRWRRRRACAVRALV